jgi:hypothetical protein
MPFVRGTWNNPLDLGVEWCCAARNEPSLRSGCAQRHSTACPPLYVTPGFLVRRWLLPLHLSKESEHDRPRRLVLIHVDQQLAEAPRLRVSPELADPLGTLKVGKHQDVAELGAWGRTERVEEIEEYSFEVARGPRGSTLVPWLAAESRYASARDLLAAAVPCGHYSAL